MPWKLPLGVRSSWNATARPHVSPRNLARVLSGREWGLRRVRRGTAVNKRDFTPPDLERVSPVTMRPVPPDPTDWASEQELPETLDSEDKDSVWDWLSEER